MENVSKDFCDERHKTIKTNEDRTERRLNDHSGRLDKVEDAILKLTIMVDSLSKRNFWDKVLIISVFLIGLVLAGVVFGPDVPIKVIGGVKP